MSPRAVFLVVFAVMWAAVTPSLGRYDPFNTAAFFSGKPRRRALARRRFLVAFGIGNLVPLAVLALAFWIVPDDSRPVLAAVGGAFAGISPAALPRLFHGFMASTQAWPRYFTSREWNAVMDRWSPHRIDLEDPAINHRRAHLLPGAAYLVVPLAVGWSLAVAVG